MGWACPCYYLFWKAEASIPVHIKKVELGLPISSLLYLFEKVRVGVPNSFQEVEVGMPILSRLKMEVSILICFQNARVGVPISFLWVGGGGRRAWQIRHS